MKECRCTKAEEDAYYHRLAYLIAKRLQEKRRTICREVVGGGCVVLQPELFRRGNGNN